MPEAVPALDRRGFQLLHWPPPRPNARGKPAELSLEHEARLAPGPALGLQRLRAKLAAAADGGKAEVTGPLAGLFVRRYIRSPGANSVDRYYDLPGDGSLIGRMISIRERMVSRDFMTWSTEDGASNVRPLNLELPFATISDGVIVRLEFNWIDDLERCLEDAAAGRPTDRLRRNPLRVAALAGGFDFRGIMPVLQHTTFREKFGLVDAEGIERFQLNIDSIVAQSLADGRQGSYVDVDIAPVDPVGPLILKHLKRLSAGMIAVFGLQPAGATKVWRSRQATES